MIAGYEIADFLAWDAATWDRLLGAYHTAIWPAQVVAVLIFVAALWFGAKSKHRFATAPVILVLAAFWVWVAWFFHGQHHAQLNWAAHYWVIACVTEAFLLVVLVAFTPKTSKPFPVLGWWPVCMALPLFVPVLISAGWGRPLTSWSWPLVTPDALAWVTVITLIVLLITGGSRAIGLLIVVPSLLLLVDGLIAFSLPAHDRLLTVVIAFASMLAIAGWGVWATKSSSTRSK